MGSSLTTHTIAEFSSVQWQGQLRTDVFEGYTVLTFQTHNPQVFVGEITTNETIPLQHPLRYLYYHIERHAGSYMVTGSLGLSGIETVSFPNPPHATFDYFQLLQCFNGEYTVFILLKYERGGIDYTPTWKTGLVGQEPVPVQMPDEQL